MMAKAEEQKDHASGKEETPSMEEILQSIRGVISGDEAPAEPADDILELTDIVEDTAQAAVVAAPENSSPEKSILDDIDDALDDGSAKVVAESEKPAETVAAEVAQPVPETAVESAPEVVAELTPEPIPEPVTNDSQTSSEAEMTNEIPAEDTLEADTHIEPIVMDASAVSASGSLIDDEVAKQSSGTLKALVNSVNDKHISSPSTRSGTSLEELVIEAIKPFLADWLNKNLPAIVKKIVEKEVKRLIPKEDDDD